MTSLNKHQLKDALLYMERLDVDGVLPEEPAWGDGNHLILPDVIPLKWDDGYVQDPVAWLVANDFNAYELTTEDPTKKETR